MAVRENGMPWCEHCQGYHHPTAECIDSPDDKQRIRNLEAALMVYGFTLEYVLQLKGTMLETFTESQVKAARDAYYAVFREHATGFRGDRS